jgi:hypothetical protein
LIFWWRLCSQSLNGGFEFGAFGGANAALFLLSDELCDAAGF